MCPYALSKTQVALFMIFQPFSYGPPLSVLVKNHHFSPSWAQIPLQNTSCVFHDFPPVFVGYPLSALVKNPFFSPSCAHIPLQKHKLRFSWFSSLFHKGPPYQFYSKILSFRLHRHISPFINTSCVFHGFPAFFVGDPYQFDSKPSLFSFMCAYSLSQTQVAFSWFSSLFRRVPPYQF